MFPGLDLHYAGPAQPVTAPGEEPICPDDLDHVCGDRSDRSYRSFVRGMERLRMCTGTSLVSSTGRVVDTQLCTVV